MKRLIDLAAALMASVLLLPVMAAVAVLIRMVMGPPVLFVQARAGLNGRPFRLLKFRTMRPAEDPETEAQTDAQRLTGLGRWLRRWSLDELPQLWNIFAGEMSLVGPRPLPVRYLPRYSEQQARRHEVQPGLTGWAQVNGRNAQSWEERFALDLWYVEHRTLSLDLRIIARTLRLVLEGRGVSQPSGATMEEFRG